MIIFERKVWGIEKENLDNKRKDSFYIIRHEKGEKKMNVKKQMPTVCQSTSVLCRASTVVYMHACAPTLLYLRANVYI